MRRNTPAMSRWVLPRLSLQAVHLITAGLITGVQRATEITGAHLPHRFHQGLHRRQATANGPGDQCVTVSITTQGGSQNQAVAQIARPSGESVFPTARRRQSSQCS